MLIFMLIFLHQSRSVKAHYLKGQVLLDTCMRAKSIRQTGGLAEPRNILAFRTPKLFQSMP